MLRKNLDFDWSFQDGQPRWYGESPARSVNLPHDFLIEQDTTPDAPGGASTGYYGGAAGIYTKFLEFDADQIGRRALLEFDGVYMNARVELNGQLVMRHHYGYTPFHADLTPYVRPGKNRLQVIVDNTAQPNSRWYSGAGIYRHVDLLTAGRIHIAPWGIFAHTAHVANGTAAVIVETTVENHTESARDLWVTSEIRTLEGALAGSRNVKLTVPAGGKATARAQIAVPGAHLWDIDDPFRYEVTSALTDGAAELDWDRVTFGVRTVTVDAVNGFCLNGRTLKLKGGCIHHDNGLLGAESYFDSEYRKLKLHKDNGFFAIRTAHNPPSRDMLEACDELGILVIDEAFDCWRNGKNAWDYSQYFETDWEADIERFLLRDRSHPSVVIWSTGNEVVERGGMSGGYELAAKLAEKMRAIDPTRPVTNALCSLWNGIPDEDMEKMQAELAQHPGKTIENAETPFIDGIWGSYTEAFAAPLDIVGYNYLNKRYVKEGERFPGRVICGTESFPNDFDNIWRDTMACPYVIGDFTWTSYDYIGEAGIGKSIFGTTDEAPSHISEYPWKLANDSDFDLTGFTRPQLGFRKVVWGDKETFLAVQAPERFGLTESVSRWGFEELWHSWTWPKAEGKPVRVVVFTAAEEAELLLNGKSLGRKQTERFRAEFDVTYEPGTLEAVSFTGGKEVSRAALRTAGKPASIVLKAEKPQMTADGRSLCFVNAFVVDETGTPVPGVALELTAACEGAAELAAFGSANPKTTDNYAAGRCVSFDGRAQAILRAGRIPGKAVVRVKSELGETVLGIPVL